MAVLLETFGDSIDDRLRIATELLRTDPKLTRQLAQSVLAEPSAQAASHIVAQTLIAKAEFALGSPEQGFAHFRQAIERAHAKGLRNLECEAQIHLGERLTHLSGNLPLAMKAFDRAQQLAEGQSDQRMLGQVYAAKAPLLGRMGRLSECESLLRLALQMLHPELDQRLVTIARNNLAHVMVQDGRLEQALIELHANTEASQDGPAPRRRGHQRSLARVLARLGRSSEALEILNSQLLELAQKPDRYDWASNRICAGEAMSYAGQPHVAVALLSDVLSYTREHQLHSLEIDVLHALAKACEQAGDLKVALQVERDLSRLERLAIDREAAERARLTDAMARLHEERIAKQALERTHALLERRVKERSDALQREVRERTLAERMALHWAEHDWLTGLGNRSFLNKKLQQAFQTVQAANADLEPQQQAQLAVMFIDLDGFKLINDSFGHLIGDRVLATFARRLMRCMPEGSVVSRYGGDEFIVVLPTRTPAHINAESAQAAAERAAQVLLDRLERRIRTQAGYLHLSASIGMALCPRDADTPDELLLQADRAMQQSKKAGGRRFCQLDLPTRHLLARQGVLRRDLRQAILQGDLRAWYQPVIDVRSGAVRSIELLARWDHPSLGAVPPAEFVALAEEQGLASALADWSLNAAVQASLQVPAHHAAMINVNLSPRVLSEVDLAPRYARSVVNWGGQPHSIRFELTESVQLAEDPRCLRNLEHLHKHGFSLALDDFGAGYSCFNYLSRVHFDQVKLDRSMVDNCLSDRRSQTVIRSVVSMAHALSMEVVAEGVETEAQLAHLLDQRCDLIQGYLLAEPMPLDTLLRWLSQR